MNKIKAQSKSNKVLFFIMYFNVKNVLQKMEILLLTHILATVLEGTGTESCRDVLQGYLSGQSSCAQGMYQLEAFKREFKSFTNGIEQSIKEFKDKVKAEMQIIKGRVLFFTSKSTTKKLVSQYQEILAIFSLHSTFEINFRRNCYFKLYSTMGCSY